MRDRIRAFSGRAGCVSAGIAYNTRVSLRTDDYHYDLPADLIASQPLADRAASRMLVLHRASGRIEHRRFRELPEYLRPGDLLVLNDTKVVPARFFSDDGRVELLRLDAASPLEWRCLVKPGKRMKAGREIRVGGVRGVVTQVLDNGDRIIRWDEEVDIDAHGRLALPHYMGRDDLPADRDRYQTVFAREEGAIAAPTAGLHFTPDLLATLPHAFLTLHVGVGTFRPVQAEIVTDHVMHEENYHVSAETAGQINRAERVIAVGTTVVRVLETLGRLRPSTNEGTRLDPSGHRGSTAIFIHPPFDFRVTDALLTNFHLPCSTLMMLVSALAGRDAVLTAYREAVAEQYRFYSYGDCMLVI